MGIKNLEWLNLALLGNRKWRILNEEGQWVDILRSRYRVSRQDVLSSSEEQRNNKLSSSRRNIGLLGRSSGGGDWFAERVKRKAGRGDKTSFWEDIWVGEKSLKDLFPWMFYLSEQKSCLIESIRVWSRLRWEWNLIWRRYLFV